MKTGILVSALLLLTACASDKEYATTTATERHNGLCGEAVSAQEGLQLSIAQQAFQRGEYRSSLALLEKVKTESTAKIALQANALRKSGEREMAELKYRKMLTTCLRGNAEHGLGMIAIDQGQYSNALEWLRKAARDEPTNANIRNDLGFLLFSIGKYHHAKGELLTALELNPNHSQAARNLWMALMKNGEASVADNLASHYGWSLEDQHKMRVVMMSFRPLDFDGNKI